jgi:hypothetical protein
MISPRNVPVQCCHGIFLASAERRSVSSAAVSKCSTWLGALGITHLMTGWWFQPLKNMKVSSGYYSQYMEKNVPNHHDQTDGQFHTIPFFGKKLRIFSSHVCHVDWNGTFYNISDHVKLGFSNHVNLGLSSHVTLPKGITGQHTLEI